MDGWVGLPEDEAVGFHAPRGLRGVLCEKYNDGWMYEGGGDGNATDPDPRRWVRFTGPPCTGRAGHFYFRNGFNWMEDGKGNAWYSVVFDKPMRDFLVQLHVNTARSYSPMELEAMRTVVHHRLPGWKTTGKVLYYVKEAHYLRSLRRSVRFSFGP